MSVPDETAVQQELATNAVDTLAASIAAAAEGTSSSAIFASANPPRVVDVAVPEATPRLSSSLSFTGLSVEDARGAETEIAAGIARSLPGVSADDVSVTGYTTAADGSLIVEFKVPCFEV